MVGVARIVPVVLIGALAACGGTDRSPGGAGTVPTTAPATAPTGGPAPRAPFVVTDDLDTPVAVAWRRGDPRAYVAEQDGRIVTVATDGRIGSEPVLEVAVSDGGEQGLLGLAFSADGTTLYTHLTDPDGDTRVDSWRMGPERADPASRRTQLVVDQPFDNHNGGSVVLGPDGLLYVGLGDGGAAGDPADNAQDPDSLLGKIVRLDPGRDDLPQPEIYMSGLRNPWRFSFDRETGAIWIGDVGQNEVEEIDTAPAGAAGINWGWDGREGTRPFEGPPVAGARDPILEIPHGPACSVIGGYVYRGSAAPDLRGRYVYGDYCDPAIRSFTVTAGRAGPRSELARVEELTSFGEDLAGELWATSGTGALVRLTGRRTGR